MRRYLDLGTYLDLKTKHSIDDLCGTVEGPPAPQEVTGSIPISGQMLVGTIW